MKFFIRETYGFTGEKPSDSVKEVRFDSRKDLFKALADKAGLPAFAITELRLKGETEVYYKGFKRTIKILEDKEVSPILDADGKLIVKKTNE